MKRKIVLHHTHEAALSGYITAVEEDVKQLVVPMICGCKAIFASAGWTEKDADGFDMEVWKQVAAEFNEYWPG